MTEKLTDQIFPESDIVVSLEFIEHSNNYGLAGEKNREILKGNTVSFQPITIKKLDASTALNRIIYFFLRVLMVMFSFWMQFQHRFNSKSWSGYLMGIYRKNKS